MTTGPIAKSSGSSSPYSSDALHLGWTRQDLRLVNGNELVDLVFEHYDSFSPEWKRLLHRVEVALVQRATLAVERVDIGRGTEPFVSPDVVDDSEHQIRPQLAEGSSGSSTDQVLAMLAGHVSSCGVVRRNRLAIS